METLESDASRAVGRICIRPAGHADIPALLPLVRGLTDAEQQLNTWALTNALAGAEWRGQLGTDFGCLVADERGVSVGLASYYIMPGPPPTLYANGVFVLPDRRRRDVGRGLMRALAREAQARGCAAMVWHIVASDAVSREFSVRMGARPGPDGASYQFSRDAISRFSSVAPDNDASAPG